MKWLFKAVVEKQGDDTDDKDAPSKDEPTFYNFEL